MQQRVSTSSIFYADVSVMQMHHYFDLFTQAGLVVLSMADFFSVFHTA
ncbi:hypothetical protein [Aeromonas sobria]